MKHTEAQVTVCKVNGIDTSDFVEWVGKTAVFRYEGRYAMVNEHGSVTYCEEAMYDAHKAGVPK